MPTTTEDYMRIALALARKGWGETSPNPMVGAVLVKNGRIISQGWHHKDGAPHAEIECLRAAEESPEGAEMYVTLEPCSYTVRALRTFLHLQAILLLLASILFLRGALRLYDASLAILCVHFLQEQLLPSD